MGRLGGRWASWIGLAIVMVGASWCGWRWWDVRWHRDTLARIEADMNQGLYAVAARDLTNFLERSPDSARAAYLLGVSEKARGHLLEANTAWARIAPDSPMIGRAAASRLDMFLERGQLADAERLIEAATRGNESEGSSLRVLMIPTLIQEGRNGEAERLLESGWRALNAQGKGAYELAVNVARLHMELRWNVPPVEMIRSYLDHVGQLQPDDDRIWLGRANLAIRAGSLDEAARLIADCLRQRPDDPAVWRARLNWALRTHRPAEARDALKHLPAEWLGRAEVHRLSAWFASECGDAEGERRELAALVAEAPEDFQALDRLRELEHRGASGTPSDLEGRKAQVEGDQTRYRELHRRNQPARDAKEIARLADRLGHPFEAIAYLTAAIAEEPDRDDLREQIGRFEEALRRSDEAIRGRIDRLPNDPGER